MRYKKKQLEALEHMRNKENVFITGGAGVGKSFVIKEFVQSLSPTTICLCCASTGVAAQQISGVTIHRLFGLPIKPLINHKLNIPNTLQKADILIIDEISMCRIDIFEHIGKVILKENKRRENSKIHKQPLQLIVVGDFFQLAPVITDDTRIVLDTKFPQGVFAFEAPTWKKFNFIPVILDEVVRQSDKAFINALNQVRTGNMQGIEYITLHSKESEIKDAVTLCTVNRVVRQINAKHLDKLKGQETTFNAIIKGQMDDCIAEKNLILKKNCKVMMLANAKEYKNGNLGTVINIHSQLLKVKLDTTEEIVDVERYVWNTLQYKIIEVNGVASVQAEVIGSLEQFPVKLAYAITVHKSQGQTYEKMNFLPNCFAAGQLYVALSRVEKLSGLFIKGQINESELITAKSVQDFYKLLEAPHAETEDITTKSKPKIDESVQNATEQLDTQKKSNIEQDMQNMLKDMDDFLKWLQK